MSILKPNMLDKSWSQSESESHLAYKDEHEGEAAFGIPLSSPSEDDLPSYHLFTL